MTRPDVIVLGVGAMGSAACWQLALRGLRVLGIEQFDLAHERGSSHGQTRIIRQAYFEHPDYAPLLVRSYALWTQIEQQTQTALFERCGLLLAGIPDGEVIRGVQRTMQQHPLGVETLSNAACTARFPHLRVGEELTAMYEADAGYLRVEECVSAMARLALRHGATILSGQQVRGWSAHDGGVCVELEHGTVEAGALVITAGAWAARQARLLGAPLTVLRKPQLWFDGEATSGIARSPVFAFDLPEGFFYGFPSLEGEMKIAMHSGGDVVDDPDQVDRTLHPADAAPVRAFILAHLPSVPPFVKRYSVCMYTMTPDRHFIIDIHPQHRCVALACGLSGHGFKFAPLVGQLLAETVMSGVAPAGAGLFTLSRFGSALR